MKNKSRILLSIIGCMALAATVAAQAPYMRVQNGASYLNDTANPVKVQLSANGDGTYSLATSAPSLAAGAATGAKQDTGNASLGSIDGKLPAVVSGRIPVDGSGVTQPISATALPLPNGAAIAANQTSANTKLDTLHTDMTAATPAGENFMGYTGGASAAITASFTRPANTTAYTVNTSVSDSTSAATVLTLTNSARKANGTGRIMKARLVKNSTTTTGANFRVYLYNAAPTAINDGSAFTLLWANRGSRVGWIDFSSMSTEGTGSDCATALVTAAAIDFACTGGSQNLYAVVVHEGSTSYTPTSGEQFFLEFSIDQN